MVSHGMNRCRKNVTWINKVSSLVVFLGLTARFCGVSTTITSPTGVNAFGSMNSLKSILPHRHNLRRVATPTFSSVIYLQKNQNQFQKQDQQHQSSKLFSIHHPSSHSFLPDALRTKQILSTSTLLHLSSQPQTNGEIDAYTKPTNNEYLVNARLAVAAAKRQTRKNYLEEDKQRNLRLKRLLHTESSNHSNYTSVSEDGYPIPAMYALRLSVDKELREELRMNGRERRGRVFIEMGAKGCQSLKGLKMELHSFFRCLKKSTYTLSAGLPIILEDGSVSSPLSSDDDDESDDLKECTEENDPSSNFWPIECDEDVKKTFEQAIAFYQTHNTNNLNIDSTNRLKRPSILIHVQKDPNAPIPPPPPSYLENMADPAKTESMTMISFYAFPQGGGVKDPEEFGFFLKKVWRPFHALGRVYVAQEGINAQMSIPTNVLDNFMACCMEIPELGVHMENGINIDPVPLTLEEFSVAGGDIDGKPSAPFKNLHIRVKHQIVADGLNKALDWEEAGYDMPPMEWHEKIKSARQKRSEGKEAEAPLIFDCRNDYETSVGRFEGAEPLNTTNFRDSWNVLKESLKEKPKDTPIMTYCTGGIRCVKVGAYLTQELGFTNVSRLAGGIIAYDRTLNKDAPKEEPMFKGTNYVFDGRVGRQITDDKLADCITCGVKTNLISNCNNDNCHKRMAQCADCRDKYLGTCSEACKTRVINSGTLPPREKDSLLEDDVKLNTDVVKYNSTNQYSLGHSTTPPAIFEEIELNTAKFIATGAHMLSDEAQGRILKNLASVAREGRVLEIGTFAGYSTACFLEGAADAAEAMGCTEVGNEKGGPFVMSLERDSRAIDLAAQHLKIISAHGFEEEGALEASKLREENNLLEVDDDQTSFACGQAGCKVVRVTDALATVEAMAEGLEFTSVNPFDIVFIDGDKTRFLDYVEACLNSNRVLKKGGLMLVDNVLWKGLVLDASGGGMSQRAIDKEEDGLTKVELKKNRRARKLANKVHRFNSAIVQDNRVEVLMLPIRDGLSIIRKK